METNKEKPSMNFGAIPTNKKEVVKKVKTAKVTKPAKQKLVKETTTANLQTKALGRKRHIPEDWIKLGVKIDQQTKDDLKIALVHFREKHPSQDVFVNAAIQHYIKYLNK